MMNNQQELDKIFRKILGSSNVYFQPPENVRMKYPAIRYERDGFETIRADNGLYQIWSRYEVTLIDSNPMSSAINELLVLDYCKYDRHYVSDNLNHDVFTICTK